jgi:diguanylate cyclase (GGDEF)-like protein/PAS domain S-box-containing protein
MSADLGKVDIGEIHWMMDLFDSIDVGLIVLDQECRVHVWNGFMANHSGHGPDRVIGKSLLAVFPELPKAWFQRKVESVRLLKSRAFTTWEERAYLLRFKSHRPITGSAEFMYQSVTFLPLVTAAAEVSYVAVVIHDVTDIAVGKQAVERANRELERLSRTDRLTQLSNRGYWEECLVREFNRVRRTGRPSTLVMFDIDHFKKVNDTYGHQAGDEVLRHTAATLRQCMRTTDLAGRYGGEEFAIILVDTPLEGGRNFAERLRAMIEATSVAYQDQVIRHTISLGLATLGDGIHEPKQWIERADQALYQAKRSGRNQARVFEAA